MFRRLLLKKTPEAHRASISESRIHGLGNASSVELPQRSTRLYTGNFRLPSIAEEFSSDNGNIGDRDEARVIIHGILGSVKTSPYPGMPV